MQFFLWKEKRGETVLGAALESRSARAYQLRTTFVRTTVGVAHYCCTYPLAGPRLLPLAKSVTVTSQFNDRVHVGVSGLTVCIHGLFSSPRVLVGR